MFITKPQRTRSLTAVLILTALFFVGNPNTGNAQSKTVATPKIAPYTTVAVTTSVNEARIDEGLSALRTNAQLTLAAQRKATHMVANNYFSHWAPDGTSPWEFIENAGYNYQNAGENLAIHFFNTEKMVQAWLKSPGHRANIMNGDYTETGIGIAYGEIDGEEGWIVVQLFGSR